MTVVCTLMGVIAAVCFWGLLLAGGWWLLMLPLGLLSILTNCYLATVFWTQCGWARERSGR